MPPDEPLDADAAPPPPPPPHPISMPLHKIEIRKLILFFEIGNFIFTPIQPWNSFAIKLPELLAWGAQTREANSSITAAIVNYCKLLDCRLEIIVSKRYY
jgi:hypothetical protein